MPVGAVEEVPAGAGGFASGEPAGGVGSPAGEPAGMGGALAAEDVPAGELLAAGGKSGADGTDSGGIAVELVVGGTLESEVEAGGRF